VGAVEGKVEGRRRLGVGVVRSLIGSEKGDGVDAAVGVVFRVEGDEEEDTSERSWAKSASASSSRDMGFERFGIVRAGCGCESSGIWYGLSESSRGLAGGCDGVG